MSLNKHSCKDCQNKYILRQIFDESIQNFMFLLYAEILDTCILSSIFVFKHIC